MSDDKTNIQEVINGVNFIFLGNVRKWNFKRIMLYKDGIKKQIAHIEELIEKETEELPEQVNTALQKFKNYKLELEKIVILKTRKK